MLSISIGTRVRAGARAVVFAAGIGAMALAGAGPLVIGQVAPLTGGEATQGRAYAAGVQLHFDQLNAAGGIGGNTLVLASRDDAARPEQTLQETRKLLTEQKPLALTGYFGAANVSALLESGILGKEKLPLVGFRAAQVATATPYVYSIRAGMADQIDKIVQHVATLGIQRIGLFYEDGPQSAAVLSTVEASSAKRKVQIVARAQQEVASTRTSDAVTAMLNAAPQAIILQASAAASSFIEGYRAGGGGAQLFGTSDVDVEQLAKRLGDEQLAGISIAQVTPSPTKLSSRLTRDFQQAYKAAKSDRPVSHSMFEGYIAARVIAEAVRRAGANPTRESLVRSLDGMERLDLGDYLISFAPGVHTGSRFVDLSIVGAGGQLRQ